MAAVRQEIFQQCEKKSSKLFWSKVRQIYLHVQKMLLCEHHFQSSQYYKIRSAVSPSLSTSRRFGR
jgi:hypothetical protein